MCFIKRNRGLQLQSMILASLESPRSQIKRSDLHLRDESREDPDYLEFMILLPKSLQANHQVIKEINDKATKLAMTRGEQT